MKDLSSTAESVSPLAPVAPLAPYNASRLNALQHGVLSKFEVLPWEDPSAYAALLAALEAEHKPNGPTQFHLVEELAGVLWRKRRLYLAEASAYQRGLEATTDSYNSAKTTAAALVTTPEKPTLRVADTLSVTPTEAKRELGRGFN